MGGKESIDYLAPSGSGENTLVTCEHGDYAADLEIARGVPRAPDVPGALDAPARGRDARRDDDRGARRVPRHRRGRDVEGDAGREERRHARARARPRRRSSRGGEAGGRARLRLPPGERRGDPRSVRRRPGLARAARLRRRGGRRRERCARGSSSPARTARAGISAASRPGETSRRASPTSASREKGTSCPKCGGDARFQTAIEIGHIFKFGTRYSKPLGATFLDEDGTERALIGGSYGIGPARVMAAAVEQSHDELGIVWPASIAPYDVHVVALTGAARRSPRASQRRLLQLATTCCSTTATNAPARSLRTPT